jgi:hypothetical protein
VSLLHGAVACSLELRGSAAPSNCCSSVFVPLPESVAIGYIDVGLLYIPSNLSILQSAIIKDVSYRLSMT